MSNNKSEALSDWLSKAKVWAKLSIPTFDDNKLENVVLVKMPKNKNENKHRINVGLYHKGTFKPIYVSTVDKYDFLAENVIQDGLRELIEFITEFNQSESEPTKDELSL